MKETLKLTGILKNCTSQSENMDREDEVMMSSSLSRSNPVAASSKMKQLSPLENKKKKTSKKILGAKSKFKQLTSGGLKQKSKCCMRKRTRLCDIYNNLEDQFIVMERAGKLLQSLDRSLPGFAKCMLPSNVTYSFWLILPKPFCNIHLPQHDATITLVNECGEEFKTNYLMGRHGLSAGWRGFAITHKLLKGDMLLFLLVEPCKLKVYIVRLHCLDVVEAAHCLMSLDTRMKRIYSEKCEAQKDKSLNEAPKEKSLKREAPKNNLLNKQFKKGKRTHRSPKKFAPPLVEPEEDGEKVSIVDQYEIGNAVSSSDTRQGAVPEITNSLQPKELSCCGSSCYSDNLGEGISCRSTARSLYSSSTLAT